MGKLPGHYQLCSALVGSRTPNLLIRSQMLYPIELRVRVPNRRLGLAICSVWGCKYSNGAGYRKSLGAVLQEKSTRLPWPNGVGPCKWHQILHSPEKPRFEIGAPAAGLVTLQQLNQATGLRGTHPPTLLSRCSAKPTPDTWGRYCTATLHNLISASDNLHL